MRSITFTEVPLKFHDDVYRKRSIGAPYILLYGGCGGSCVEVQYKFYETSMELQLTISSIEVSWNFHGNSIELQMSFY